MINPSSSDDHKSNATGRRLVLFTFAFYWLALLALVISSITYLSRPKSHPGLGDYSSPREILASMPGVQGPAVFVGRPVIERAVRCVIGNQPVKVLAYRNFHNLETGVVVPDLQGDPQVRAPGCNSTDTPVAVLDKVTPGLWELNGGDVLTSTGELRTWFSEPFRVIGP